MINFNAMVIASVVLLVGITGCNNEPEVVSTPMVMRAKAKKPKAATPKATAAASPGTAKASPAKSAAPAKGDAKQTLTKLNGYLPAAVNALQTNDVATAKKYAKAFSDNWQQKIIQFYVKNKSQDAYNKISAGVDQVNNNLLKPATPDNAKAIAALQSLSQSVKDYTTSP